MCHFLSGVISKDGKKFYFGFLNSHSGIEDGHSLKPDSYREFEWTEDDGQSLDVRTSDMDKHDYRWYKEKILSKFPTRKDLLKYISTIVCKSGKYNEIRYDDNGRYISYDEWYSDGQKANERRYYDNGNLRSDDSWYSDGQNREERRFNEDATRVSYCAWFENGNKWMEEGYNSLGNQLFYTTYYNNGQKKHETIYNEKCMRISHCSWYEDGVLERETRYDEESGFITSHETWNRLGIRTHS